MMRIATAAATLLFLAGSALAGGSLFKDGKRAPEVVINEKGEEVTYADGVQHEPDRGQETEDQEIRGPRHHHHHRSRGVEVQE
ncbi:MAG: hypothetical protein GWP05_11250 [Anaerolineaceae bacterium]|nr:hypothetical protein [Anaerolineaceae bacterium]